MCLFCETMSVWSDSCATNQRPFAGDRVIKACSSHKAKCTWSNPIRAHNSDGWARAHTNTNTHKAKPSVSTRTSLKGILMCVAFEPIIRRVIMAQKYRWAFAKSTLCFTISARSSMHTKPSIPLLYPSLAKLPKL